MFVSIEEMNNNTDYLSAWARISYTGFYTSYSTQCFIKNCDCVYASEVSDVSKLHCKDLL